MAPKISRWLRGKNKSSRSATVQETAAVQSIESDKDQKVLPTEETPLIRQNATSQNGNHDIDRDDTSDRPSNVASSLMLSDSLGESVREGIKSVSLRLDRMRRQISEVVAAHTGSIGYLGSYAIAVNSLTGPAMLELPAAYAVSGLIPTTATILFVCLFPCCLLFAPHGEQHLEDPRRVKRLFVDRKRRLFRKFFYWKFVCKNNLQPRLSIGSGV